MLPKSYISKSRIRKQAYGNERRRNIGKIILDKNTPLPKPVEINDIDREFNNWVISLNVSFEGKHLPIFKLFSNQRIGEYAQSWKHVDEVGNLLLNFFTITRDTNPKQGENQGGSFNIPGSRDYPLFIIPSLDDNGEEKYEMYTMKQPYCADFEYTLTLITNKYELLNEVNQKILSEFKSLEKYIAPNGYYMPMILGEITDESEYAIDDRKYYSQTYSIKLMGYIIRQEDFDVKHIETRLISRLLETDTPRSKRETSVEIEEIEDYEEPLNSCCPPRIEDPDPYANKKFKILVNFPKCKYKTDFNIDVDFTLDTIQTENVYDFILKINNDLIDFESEEEIKVFSGDKIELEMERDDAFKDSSITIIGISDERIDMREKECILDEIPSEEEIIVD